MSGRIDVHQHLIPPRYQAKLDDLARVGCRPRRGRRTSP